MRIEITKKNTILVVDDNPRNIQVLAGLLQKEGLHVLFARNAIEAIDIIMDRQVDIILLDIMMPGMDGFTLAEKLKQDPVACEIPIIFLTALSDPLSISRGFSTGAVDYISKPFQTSELVARVKTHLRLRNVEKELKAMNAVRDKFFSLIAHDLKNPLAGIIGITEDILDEGPESIPPAEIKELIRLINVASHRELNLLDNLLQWSSVQTNKVRNAPERIHAPEIINSVIDGNRDAAKYKDLDLIIGDLSATFLYVDKQLLIQVLQNLVSNAIKYSHRGSSIEIGSRNQSDRKTEIYVKDKGVGIGEYDLQRLFEIDNRLSIPGTEQESGAGLGLLICKDLVDRMGGEIFVESKIGEGTNFILSFPTISPDIEIKDQWES